MRFILVFAGFWQLVVFGQGTNHSDGDFADPFRDIAAAHLDASCDVNKNAAQLQAARDRLARFQAALADVRWAKADAQAQLNSGSDLTRWTARLGAAQMAQGVADGFMSIWGMLGDSTDQKLYNLGKSVGDCGNAVITGTKAPGDCVASLSKSASAMMTGFGKNAMGFAGSAAGVINNATAGKTTDAATSAASSGVSLLKVVGSDSIATTMDGVTKGVVGVSAAMDGDVPKAAENIPKTIGKFVSDENLSKGLDTTGDVFKAAGDTLKGYDTFSSAQDAGANLNTLTNSAYDSIAARETDLSSKALTAQQEVDRLTQCQQQIDAAGLTTVSKKDNGSSGSRNSLDEIMAKQGKSTSVSPASDSNSAFLQKLTDSMKEASSAGAVPSPAGDSPESNSLLNSLSNSLPMAPNQLNSPGIGSITSRTASSPAPMRTVCDSVICTVWQGSLVVRTYPNPAATGHRPACVSTSGASCGVQ